MYIFVCVCVCERACVCVCVRESRIYVTHLGTNDAEANELVRANQCFCRCFFWLTLYLPASQCCPVYTSLGLYMHSHDTTCKHLYLYAHVDFFVQGLGFKV